MLTNYNQAGDWTNGDFNHDGLVNFTDLNALLTNYNQCFTSDAEVMRALSLAGVAVAPEPSALVMLAAALRGAYAWRKQ